MTAGVTGFEKRPRWRWGHLLAGVGAAAVLVGSALAWLAVAHRPPATGELALVGTQRGGTGAHVTSLVLRGDGVSASIPAAANLHRAPAEADLGIARVAQGRYTHVDAQVDGRDLTASLTLDVAASGVTPLLLVVDGEVVHAYAGNEAVNLGRQLASGQATIPPDVTFTDQAGRRVPLSSLRGRVTVVTAFESHCHESCPLYTAVLADLERTLRARGLADRVNIAEVTMDPGRDTPGVLAAYAHLTGADWNLLTAPPDELQSFWDSLHAEYHQVPYDGTPPTDWYTGRPETYDLVHTSLAAVLDPSGAERVILQGDPRLGHALSPALQGLLTTPAAHPTGEGTWSLGDLLDWVDLLLDQPAEETRGPEAAARAGSPAPAFTLPGLNGGSVSLSRQIGRPVIVNFWATWCVPCRKELPALAQAAKAHPDLTVLAVDEGEDASAVRSYLHDVIGDDQSLTVLLDDSADVGGTYAVGGLPVSVFVDAGGTVRVVIVGELDSDRLAQGLAAVHA